MFTICTYLHTFRGGDHSTLQAAMYTGTGGMWTSHEKVRIFVCLFGSYYRPYSAHAGHIGTDRSLLTGHNALLLGHS